MGYTISDIAATLGASPIGGNFSTQITSVASLEQAEAGQLSFLGNEKYLPQFRETKASAVLVPSEIKDGPDGVTLIPVANPSFAFSQVMASLVGDTVQYPLGVSSGAYIDPEAILNPAKVSIAAGVVVGAGATIGEGTTLRPGVVIEPMAKVGKDCLLHANAVVREQCELGDRVVLQPNAVIGSDGFGFELINGKHEKIPQVGIVVIEDDVEIGANSIVDRARFGKTFIGEGTKIDNLNQIAHNVEFGKHCLMAAQSGIAGSSKLGDYVTLAAQTGVTGHVELGDQTVVGARSGVSKSLEGNQVYLGYPAIPMKESQRSRAFVKRLPKMANELRDLKARIEEIEQNLQD